MVVRHVLLPLQNLAQPGQFFLFLLRSRFLAVGGLFVFPVWSDTIFCNPVHLISTDLNLKRLSVRSDQGCMQGLVTVWLRHRNVIFETARDRRVHFMDDTERCIAVFDGFHDDADRKEVIDLIQRLVLVDHLFVDAEKVLDSSVDICLNAGLVDMTGHLFYDRIDKLLPLLPLHADLLHQFIVRIRLQIFQRKVIEFDLDLGNTEALCDRGIDIHRLTRFFLLRLRRPVLCGPHVVQTIRQFYQNNADILCHRKEHLSQVFCLLLDLIRRIFQLCQLRDTAYNQGHLRAELLGQLFFGHDGIFDNVVQKACRDRLLVELQICQDNCHTERMDDVRFPALSFLVLMCIRCHAVCFFDQGNIVRWMIFFHRSDQFPV